jgi:hypothetical protein
MGMEKTGARLAPDKPTRWLLLVHQLPPRPAYLRVKIWRRLREIGAVALKNSVYILPRSEQTRENFERLLHDIEKSGGDGLICEVAIGMRDDRVKSSFNAARDADYQALAKTLRVQENRRRKNRDAELKLKLEKARQRLAQIARIDFFGAGGRHAVEELLSRLEHSPLVKTDGSPDGMVAVSSLAGRIWVTRQGVHVDRIACAWLIRRFIDPKAKFRFVQNKTYRHAKGELRFDMANAEFTHEGDKCSFEVLLERMNSADASLAAIAEIVHNLDLKDQKFARPETSRIGHILEGICAPQNSDADRIARGSAMFDDTYEKFRRESRK